MNDSHGDDALDPRLAGEFVRLFTDFSRRIFSYILTLVPNHADAEEIFQETSATLWAKFGDYEPGTNFGAWACKVAYFKALNFRSKQKNAPRMFSDEFLQLVDEETLKSDEALDALYRALADCYAKLEKKDREIVDLRYTPGATTAGIANVAGRSKLWVYRSLSRIHQRLFDCVNGTNIG
jgi:RNA polymerase sigma-70 factor (ECF subfamily)